METVAYRAYSAQGCCMSGYAATPRKAANAFFLVNPTARKASVVEGRLQSDGRFAFVVIHRKESGLRWPDFWRNVSKHTTGNLPDVTRKDGGPSIKVARL